MTGEEPAPAIDPTLNSNGSTQSKTDQSSRRGSTRAIDAAALGIAALAVVLRIFVLRTTHCTIEDAYISLRYAENLANGNGFVYNLGERVLGTTTPLYTLIMALGSATPFGGLAVGKGISILADGAVCWVLYRLLCILGHPRAGLAAALLYATASAPINFSIGGMETSLVTLAGLAAIYGYVGMRSIAMCVPLAVLALLRIDGLLLAVVLLAGWFSAERKLPWRGLGIGLLVALPWLIFATAYFGSPLPQSALAKLVVYEHTTREFLSNRHILAHQFIGDIPHAVLFVFSLLGGFVAWRRYRVLRAPLIWILLYHLAILISRAPVEAFGWYFVPPLPVYYAATALGLAEAWRWPLARLPTVEHMRVGTPNVFLCVMAAGLMWNVRSITRSIAFAQNREDTLRRTAGLWLAAHAPPDARMLTEAIGYLGYFSRLRVLDMVGLVSPEVVSSYRRSQYPLGDIVERFHPELMVIRASERDEINAYSLAAGRLLIDEEYVFVRGFASESDAAYLLLYRRQDIKLRQ